MKRRTLDIIVSMGLLGLAGLLLIMGLVFTSNANFANDYVEQQLSQQNITFKRLDTLTPEEKAKPGLVKYAGQKLTTGKQAEVYANDFIGLHLESTAGGKTYAELGAVQTDLRNQVAAAQQAGASNVADLQKQLSDVTAQRETVFKGETLRGLLLTSYGFSEFGTKAEQAATVAYAGAALLFLLGIAGLVHAFMTPKTRAFAAPEHVEEKVPAVA
jgi:Tfp pilus assembly protein PilV